jgi:hypothetical protein
MGRSPDRSSWIRARWSSFHDASTPFLLSRWCSSRGPLIPRQKEQLASGRSSSRSRARRARRAGASRGCRRPHCRARCRGAAAAVAGEVAVLGEVVLDGEPLDLPGPGHPELREEGRNPPIPAERAGERERLVPAQGPPSVVDIVRRAEKPIRAAGGWQIHIRLTRLEHRPAAAGAVHKPASAGAPPTLPAMLARFSCLLTALRGGSRMA